MGVSIDRIRGRAAAAAAAILFAGAAVAAAPAEPARGPEAGVLGVLPIENLTVATPPLGDLRGRLTAALVARRVQVAEPGTLDEALARIRLRWVGGIDDASAASLRDLAHVDAILVTSIDLWDPVDPPRIGLTARLVPFDAAEVRPVWATSVHLAGDDRPGFLDTGVIHDAEILAARAVDDLAEQVAAFLASAPGPSSGPLVPASERRFRPRSLFVAPDAPALLTDVRRIVVLPFRNQSTNPRAGDVVALQVEHELVRMGGVEVVERGRVRKILLDTRLIQEGGISLTQAETFKAILDADVVVTGLVSQYKEGRPGYPALIEFSAYAVDARARRVAWLARAHGDGSDGVFLFGLREVRTAPELARELVRGILREIALKPAGRPARKDK